MIEFTILLFWLFLLLKTDSPIIYIVINVDGGTVDVFINNILVASQGNIITKISGGTIVSGQNKGLLGGIKNTFLFNKILSRSDISLLYALRYIN